MRIRDPGWKKVGSGIRDKHPGSATLPRNVLGPALQQASALPTYEYFITVVPVVYMGWDVWY